MRKTTLLAILVLLPLTVQGQKLFDCDVELCNYNGSTGKWNCEYLGCPDMPGWILNITQINTTQVNVTNTTEILNLTVTNCTSDEALSFMYEYWDNYRDQIDKRFNFSTMIAEQQESLDTCKREMDLLILSQSTATQNCVNKSTHDDCVRAYNTCSGDLKTEQDGALFKIIAGAAGGAVLCYWFFVKREEPRATDVMPSGGEQVLKPKAMQRDSEFRDRLARLEEQFSKPKKRGK